MFFLVDGSGFLYRAYYGLPTLTNKQGQNINAIFGFVKMMIKLLLQRPEYFLIARDMPHKTIRHEQFDAYKSTRPEAPDEFKRQVPQAKELVRRLGIPSLGIAGYEADDIIATYAKYAAQRGIFTTIYSSDKDLKQLIGSHIVYTDPIKRTSITFSTFQNTYGFFPEYMTTYLALCGDSSDNVPGVKGIGEKTALMLVQKYQTLDNIYAHLDELPQKVKEKLVQGREDAYKSLSLVTLIDVPEVTSLGMDTCKYCIDVGAWREILVKEWGFGSVSKLLDRLGQHGGNEVPQENTFPLENSSKDDKGKSNTDPNVSTNTSSKTHTSCFTAVSLFE